MVKIALCDDSLEDSSMLETCLRTLSKQTSIQVAVTKFLTGFDLLEHYTNDYDIIFLDVQMPTINGIELAKKIRDIDGTVSLVFMTNFPQYAMNGYSVRAYQYLLKPVSMQEIRKEIGPLLQRASQEQKQTITVHNDDGLFVVNLNDLQFAETCGSRYIQLTLSDRTIILHQSMAALEKQIANPRFFRCHASYLVNFNYIKSILDRDIELLGGIRIPVSRHRKKALKEAFMHYAGGLF